jgi:hypothetical protein
MSHQSNGQVALDVNPSLTPNLAHRSFHMYIRNRLAKRLVMRRGLYNYIVHRRQSNGMLARRP